MIQKTEYSTDKSVFLYKKTGSWGNDLVYHWKTGLSIQKLDF